MSDDNDNKVWIIGLVAVILFLTPLITIVLPTEDHVERVEIEIWWDTNQHIYDDSEVQTLKSDLSSMGAKNIEDAIYDGHYRVITCMIPANTTLFDLGFACEKMAYAWENYMGDDNPRIIELQGNVYEDLSVEINGS